MNGTLPHRFFNFMSSHTSLFIKQLTTIYCIFLLTRRIYLLHTSYLYLELINPYFIHFLNAVFVPNCEENIVTNGRHIIGKNRKTEKLFHSFSRDQIRNKTPKDNSKSCNSKIINMLKNRQRIRKLIIVKHEKMCRK